MKMITVLIHMGLIGALFTLPAQEIVIAVGQGNPPFMFEQDGEAAGIYPSLLTVIFDRMEMDMTIKSYPWKRVLIMGENGSAGIGGIYQNKNRLKIYDYSAPLYTERVLVYVTKQNMFPFHTLSDLEGKSIGILAGWSYGDDLDHFWQVGNVRLDTVRNDQMNFSMLIHGRVDCVLAPDLTGNHMINQEGYQDQIVALEKPITVNETYLVFSKGLQKKDLLEQFNRTLKAIKEDGTYDELIQSYLE